MKKAITITAVVLGSLVLVFSVFARGGKKKCSKRKNGKKLFKYLDTNNDKKVSKVEWIAKFKTIDTNNDGFISITEMKEHHNMKRSKHKRSHKH